MNILRSLLNVTRTETIMLNLKLTVSSLRRLAAVAFLGAAAVCPSEAPAADVQLTIMIRNKTTQPVRLKLSGEGVSRYSTDVLQPGSARLYPVWSRTNNASLTLFNLPGGAFMRPVKHAYSYEIYTNGRNGWIVNLGVFVSPEMFAP